MILQERWQIRYISTSIFRLEWWCLYQFAGSEYRKQTGRSPNKKQCIEETRIIGFPCRFYSFASVPVRHCCIKAEKCISPYPFPLSTDNDVRRSQRIMFYWPLPIAFVLQGCSEVAKATRKMRGQTSNLFWLESKVNISGVVYANDGKLI